MTPTTAELEQIAHRHLSGLVGADAGFRDGQLEAITGVVASGARMLVVQRTGWGKSAVYMIATRILRDRGRGPTLLISPLLVLMRNQIAMAERLGVTAATINSANADQWDDVIARLHGGEVDLLLISPERLQNERFRKQVMPAIAGEVGLFVVDEAHCVSDWGHDFRPDYRRIRRILDTLPDGTPVLCTTATANDRVIADIAEQLGAGFQVIRGPLERDSLALQVLDLPSHAERLAWLAQTIPILPGSGIVYCLTVADTHRVADWLLAQGIDAAAYTGGTDSAERLEVEARLDARDVKVVVATSALGMGYDNPELPFVIHYQSPGSAIAYYQQVGRAGRAIDRAHGVLLTGREDRDIQDYFIETAFPVERNARAILEEVEAGDEGVSVRDLAGLVNMRFGRIEAALKVLSVEGAVVKEGSRWFRTADPWTYDAARVEMVTGHRRAEQEAMAGYIATDRCLMQYLREQLDDRDAAPCGTCANCAGPALSTEIDADGVEAALRHLRRIHYDIEPRRQWPAGRRIPVDSRLAPGKALARWGDPGWGDLVRDGKHAAGAFGDELVDAVASMLGEWRLDPAPAWLTYVPSLRYPGLVPDFARRLGEALGIPALDLVEQQRMHPPQREMLNSARQFGNVRDVFGVHGKPPGTPGLLVDDVVDSRWTLTTIGVKLLEAGSGPITPVALALAPGA